MGWRANQVTGHPPPPPGHVADAGIHVTRAQAKRKCGRLSPRTEAPRAAVHFVRGAAPRASRRAHAGVGPAAGLASGRTGERGSPPLSWRRGRVWKMPRGSSCPQRFFVWRALVKFVPGQGGQGPRAVVRDRPWQESRDRGGEGEAQRLLLLSGRSHTAGRGACRGERARLGKGRP